MNHVNKIFRVAVDMIMNGSYFPSSRKGIICTALGDIAAGNAIFATSKGSLADILNISLFGKHDVPSTWKRESVNFLKKQVLMWCYLCLLCKIII